MRVLKSLILVVCLAVSVMAQDTPGNNWAQFRGNHSLTGVSQSNIPDSLKQVWTFEAGESIESSAAIVGSTVFVGSQKGGDKGELIALSLDNGSAYWKFPTDSPIGESSPAYGSGVVYIGDLGGWINAVNASDGKKLWAFKTGGEIKSSPVVVGDRVLIGSYDEHLYCLSARDGRDTLEVQDERTSAFHPRNSRRHGFHCGLRRTVSRHSHFGWQRGLSCFVRSVHRCVARIARGRGVLRHV